MNSSAAEMLTLARRALVNAYNPYSHFGVGACLRTNDNQLFAGCNAENASFSLTLCAEAAAIGSMISTGQRQITEILIAVDNPILCAPCGACRQRLYEFTVPECKIYLCNNEGLQKTLTFASLLPEAFGPNNLE